MDLLRVADELKKAVTAALRLVWLDRVPPGGEVVVAAAEGNEATEVEIACGGSAIHV